MLFVFQAALVALSCDDRQPGTQWQYTDVYINSDWITQTIKNWDNNNDDETYSRNPGSFCSTCIYNFFIDMTGSNNKMNCSDLKKDSNQSNMCASYNDQKTINKKSPTPQKDENSTNLQLPNPTFEKRSREYDPSKKIKDEENENITQKLEANSESKRDLENNVIKYKKEVSKDIDMLVLKNDNKIPVQEFSSDFINVTKNESRKVPIEDRDSSRDLKMDLDKDFDKDFEKKLREEFQEDFKKNFSRDYDTSFKNKFKKDYYLRNMGKSNGNRLRKQTAGNEGHENFKLNRYKNRNSSKIHTINPQESTDYNSLSKKFHNLRMVLARLQHSIPERNIKEIILRSQRKILPKKEISNSDQRVEYFREDKMQPVADRQFAVFYRDREREGTNHFNTVPGFNGYFL